MNLKRLDAVYCKTEAIRDAVIAFIEAQGFKSPPPSKYHNHPTVYYTGYEFSTSIWKEGEYKLNWMTVEDFLTQIAKESIPPFELTRDYDLLLTARGLDVGGNIITYEKWEEVKKYVADNRNFNNTTLEHRSFIKAVASKEIHLAILNYIKDRGFKVRQQSLDGTDWDNGFKCIGLYSGEFTSCGHLNVGNLITYEEFMDGLKSPDVSPMKLTHKYNLSINEKGIHVGCQTIDFDTYDKLIEYVQKYKNEQI